MVGSAVTQFLIRACRERQEFVDYLLERIPGAVVIYDTNRNAMDTFRAALAAAGDGPAVHMEDDIILTRRFTEKVEAAIAERPHMPIQFFSMRKADLTVGSREEPGRTFLMGQCFYLPAGMSRELLAYRWPRLREHPTGLDLMVADFMRERRMRYWLHVPSLVQHRRGKSLIDPRRSSYRQSFTFEEPDL